MRKGQTEIVVVIAMIAIIFFLALIMVYGVKPQTDIKKQASDIEPFMKATHLSSVVGKTFIEQVEKMVVETASAEVSGINDVGRTREEIVSSIENSAEERLASELSSLEAKEGCSLNLNSHPVVNVVNLSHTNDCGMVMNVSNRGDPLRITCEGDSSSYSKLLGLDDTFVVEDLRLYWVFNVTENVLSNETLLQKAEEGEDLSSSESFYEDKYGDSKCFRDLDLSLGRDGNVLWVNSSDFDRKIRGSDGYENVTYSVKHVLN